MKESREKVNNDEVLLALVRDLQQDMKDLIGDVSAIKPTLGEIHEQVKATNGRVRALETWRATVKGQTRVVSAAVGAVCGFAGEWAFKRLTGA